jgi:gluconolactonase
LPAGFGDQHDQEATSSDDAGKFLTKAKYLELFDLQRAATKAAFDALPDADLDKPGPPRFKMCPTVGLVLNLLAGHVTMHSGQIATARRVLGKPLAKDALMKRSLITRREFLAANAAVGLTLLATSARAAGISERYAGLKSDNFFAGPLNEEAKVVDQKVFTEGPAVAPDGRVFFTNASTAKILIWNPKTGQLSTFRENSGEANGLLFDHSGRLLACEGKAGRVTRTDLKTGEITVLVDQFNGHPLGAPNDLTIDAMGRIYFTSRLPNDDPKTKNVNSVYRIDPDGKVARVLHEPDIHMPNGVEISPDGFHLYLIESDGREGRNRCILVYRLHADGSILKADQFGPRLIDLSPGRGGDGLCVDEEGNLYVAAGLHKTRGTSETLDTKPGIHVISRKGTLLAYLATPIDTLTNCTFGGEDRKTLFITCGDRLLSVRTHRPGPKPLVMPG